MTKKKEIKKISSKNYFMLAVIFLISGLLFWLVVEPFRKSDKQESKLTDKLEKLSYESIDAYITERQNVIVYLTDFSEKSNNFSVRANTMTFIQVPTIYCCILPLAQLK